MADDYIAGWNIEVSRIQMHQQ